MFSTTEGASHISITCLSHWHLHFNWVLILNLFSGLQSIVYGETFNEQTVVFVKFEAYYSIVYLYISEYSFYFWNHEPSPSKSKTKLHLNFIIFIKKWEY